MQYLFESAEKINVTKRQVIDTTDKKLYIDTGYIGLYVGKGKNRHMLVMMKSGDVFPLEWTAQNQIWRSELHYRAMSDATLSVIPHENFKHYLDTLNRKDLELLFSQSVQSYNWLMERVVNLLTYDVSRRLYMRLLLLADFLDAEQGDSAVVNIPLTYVDIAESIGTTRETVNRLITALQHDGIISIDKRIITIRSISKLQARFHSNKASDY